MSPLQPQLCDTARVPPETVWLLYWEMSVPSPDHEVCVVVPP
jgi:hypothetical protein